LHWQLMGPGATVNVSSGIPYYHGIVMFPTPILASPARAKPRPSETAIKKVAPMPIKRQATANGKCKAKTKAGRPCAAPVLSGSAFCALHSDPNRAAELGRKGGARNRKVYDGDVRNVTVPESAGDVKRMLAEAMADIRAGRMDPKLASTLGYLGMSLLRAFEVAEFEQRLERLEQRDDLENQAEQTGKNEARDNR
jgi:general stress protein YciG